MIEAVGFLHGNIYLTTPGNIEPVNDPATIYNLPPEPELAAKARDGA